MNSFLLVFPAYLVGITIATGITHEAGHWIVAYLYGCNPRFSFDSATPTVIYRNTQGTVSRVLIAAAGSVPLFAFGLILPPAGSAYLMALKFLCMAHILSLTPWNSDGEIVWSEIVRHIISGERSVARSSAEQEVVTYSPESR